MFFASSVAQLLWCMNLSLDTKFGAFLSIIFMGAMLAFNCIILLKQSSLSYDDQEPEEYWLLRFAFSLQTGWSINIFVMVLNSFQAFAGYDVDYQLFSGFFSLLFFASISGKMLFANGNKPNFVIPSVISWFVVSVICCVFILIYFKHFQLRLEHILCILKNFCCSLDSRSIIIVRIKCMSIMEKN